VGVDYRGTSFPSRRTLPCAPGAETESPNCTPRRASAADPIARSRPRPTATPDSCPPEIASRAREVLEHLRELERELSLHRTLEVERIEAAARTLHRLQTAIAVCGEQGHRSSDLAELRSARRSIVDALMLTLDLLDRLTYADLDR